MLCGCPRPGHATTLRSEGCGDDGLFVAVIRASFADSATSMRLKLVLAACLRRDWMHCPLLAGRVRRWWGGWGGVGIEGRGWGLVAREVMRVEKRCWAEVWLCGKRLERAGGF